MNFSRKILYVGIPPIVGLIKIFLFSRILEAELFKNYSTFIFTCTIWASIGGASSMSRLATRFIRGSFPGRNSVYLIFTIPLAGVPFALFSPILILYYFNFPLKLDFNILLLCITSVILIVAMQISSIITAYNSRIANYNSILFIGLLRNITVLLGFYISFSEITLIKLILYETLGSLFIILLAYFTLRLDFKTFYLNTLKLKKFQISLKKRNLYPFFASVLGSFVSQIDSGISLKFLNYSDYKNFYPYILAISIGNQLNYIYSLLISATIKDIVGNKNKLLLLYFKNFLLFFALTSIVIIFLFIIKYIEIDFLSMNNYFIISISLALSITAFDYSSGLWLVKFGYKKYMYLLIALVVLKLLIASAINFLRIDNYLLFSYIFTANLILVCIFSNLIFFRKAFNESR